MSADNNDNKGMELVSIETVNAVELFTGEQLDPFLKKIEEQVLSIVPDLTTAKGRKEIASLARKVSTSKVMLDNLGKDLVADWKSKAKKVDEGRKKTRDFLDNLRDRARQPLTDYEEEEKARAEAERMAKELEEAHVAAIAENEMFDRMAEIKRKEEELARQEAERKAKEEQERMAKEKAEREEQLKREAAEAARREAEKKAEQERLRLEKEAADAKAAEEKARREKVEAEERARVEKENAIREAERKAAEEAKRVEQERLDKEAEERAIAEKKAADKRHQAKINNAVLKSLTDVEGVSVGMAKSIITAVATGKVKHMTINY